MSLSVVQLRSITIFYPNLSMNTIYSPLISCWNIPLYDIFQRIIVHIFQIIFTLNAVTHRTVTNFLDYDRLSILLFMDLLYLRKRMILLNNICFIVQKRIDVFGCWMFGLRLRPEQCINILVDIDFLVFSVHNLLLCNIKLPWQLFLRMI